MQTLSGWRTIIFASALGALGAAQTLNWATIVPPQYVGPVMIGIAALIAVFRTLTSTPVGTSQ